MADLHQRLNQYRKRHARHLQKKLAAERAGRSVTKRTLTAIENNARWVQFYQSKIKEHEEHKHVEAFRDVGDHC